MNDKILKTIGILNIIGMIVMSSLLFIYIEKINKYNFKNETVLNLINNKTNNNSLIEEKNNLYNQVLKDYLDITDSMANVIYTHNYTSEELNKYNCVNYSNDVLLDLYSKDIQTFLISGENYNETTKNYTYHRYIAIAFEPQTNRIIKNSEYKPYSIKVLINNTENKLTFKDLEW